MQNGQLPEVQTSSEQIWQLVQQEGKSARNLVAWSIPATEHSRTKTQRSPTPKGGREHSRTKTQRSPTPEGGREHSRTRTRRSPTPEGGREHSRTKTRRSPTPEGGREHSRTKTRRSPTPEGGTKLPRISRKPYQRGSTPGYSPTRRPLSKRDAVLNEELCVAVAGQYSQIQRGNKPAGKKADLRARYWCYLFDNLHRAVDEIYCTCEADESILECQEVLMTLDICRRDFHALISRINLQKAFESSSSQNRPSGLAWEVRKTTSPSKPRPHPPIQQQPPEGRPAVARSLDFRDEPKKVPTWADRVRGVTHQSGRDRKLVPTTTHEMGGDREGWEMVRRGRNSGRNSRPSSGTHTTTPAKDENETITIPSVPDRLSPATSPSGKDPATSPSGKDPATSPSGKDTATSPSGKDPATSPSGKDTATSPSGKEPATSPSGKDTATSPSGKDTATSPSGKDTATSPSGKDPATSPSGKEPAMNLGESERVTPPDSGCELREASSPVFCEEGKGAKEWTWDEIVAEYDAHEGYRQSNSWADRCDSPPDMLPDTPRSPGRALHLHQRLSSPSRRRPIEESKRISEERQVKAQQQRDRLQEEKTQKSRVALEKVREVRETRDARVKQRREEMEGKLHRAERLRFSHLQEIVRRAQEEDAKVSEIAFINTLEAQNKKIEVLERYQGHEARLQDLQDERQRKREEQQAKEEAVQERRRTLEAERIAKLMELEHKRREHDAKIEQMKQDKERAREEAAREKARERERKLEARHAAILSSAEELEKKIQLKQDESSRRYDMQLEQKKEKAAVSARHLSSEDAPRVEAYTKKKWCTICNVEIISEVYLLSHLKGRHHQESLASLQGQQNPSGVIVEASEEHQGLPRDSAEVQERLRAGRKRAKKLRQRMASRVHEHESKPFQTLHTKHRQKLQKAIRDLNRQLEGVQDSPQLDRTLGEIGRILAPKCAEDQLCFCHLGGIASLLRLLLVAAELSPGQNRKTLPEKSFLLAVNALQNACYGHPSNCRYFILSNKFAPVVDLVLQFLQVPDGISLCGPLLALLATVLSTLSHTSQEQSFDPPMSDNISYLVCVGLLDRLCGCFSAVTGPIEDHLRVQLVLAAVNMLVALTAYTHKRIRNVFTEKTDDPTSLSLALKQTELVGLLPLMYAMLLHDGPPRHSSLPPSLSPHTLTISTAAIKAINNCAILNLKMVQACLGAEGISLEFRHVVSYLLWYCSYNKSPVLLQELILAVGYFCVLNPENQVFLQSGRSPTLLQLLCGLPFEYFSNPQLAQLLYPTLVAACYHMEENRAILEQEISCKLVSAFLQDHIQKPGGEQEDDFSSLRHRFPPSHWEEALLFFS